MQGLMQDWPLSVGHKILDHARKAARKPRDRSRVPVEGPILRTNLCRGEGCAR